MFVEGVLQRRPIGERKNAQVDHWPFEAIEDKRETRDGPKGRDTTTEGGNSLTSKIVTCTLAWSSSLWLRVTSPANPKKMARQRPVNSHAARRF